jgi:uncharacterized protein YidB (DUF937 family)
MDELIKQLQGHGGQAGGGLGAGLSGGIGGLLGGGAGAMLPTLLPSVLGMLGGGSGGGQTGMHQLLASMQAKGLGNVADSWVGPGPSQPISPDQAEQALGSDKVAQLSAQSGLPVEQVRQGLSAILPGLVNHLTPNGKVPAAGEVQNAIGGLLGGLSPR